MKKAALFFLFFLLSFTVVNAESQYPQIDINGFKKWEYKQVEVSPQANYFSGITNLGGYSPTLTGGPWQERLQLQIFGKLSERLSVSYDLEQVPESPEKYNVEVKYDDTKLSFGEVNANFAGNEFANASKVLNGVMITSKSDWFDIISVPSAKLKSQTQTLTSQRGTNTRGPYNLGRGGILEGSERIQLNNIPLRRNIDYTIDYFEGKVTFSRILDSNDEFKYSYEYTNMINLFFPTISKRDFFGFQSRFNFDPERFGKPAPKEEPVVASARDSFPSETTGEAAFQEEEASGLYRLRKTPIVKFSETLRFMGAILKKNDDYLVRYDTGEIKLLTRFLPTPDEPLVVEYNYYVTSSETELIAGVGSRGPYRAKHRNLLPESERVEVNGKPFVRDLDYTINYQTGELLFGMPIGPTSQIRFAYKANLMALPPSTYSKHPKELKLGVTYLKESAKKGGGVPINSSIDSVTGQQLQNNNYLLKLANRPVPPSSEAEVTVQVRRGGVSWVLTPEVDYVFPTTELDPVTGFARVSPEVKLAYTTDPSDLTDGRRTGTIYFYNHSFTPSDEVSISYSYYKSVFGKFNGIGDGTRGPYYLHNTRAIVPGTEVVLVREQGSSVTTQYTRNSSFESNAGPLGYSINYTSDNPSITFNNDLAATKNFEISFFYIPSATSINEDISQSVFGFDGSFKIGSTFKIETAMARSESDQVFTAITTSESFPGNSTKNYPLHSPYDLIDGSEKVSVNQIRLNKDIDYFVSYTNPGQLSFYYTTPTSLDSIVVEYSYQAPGGVGTDVGTKIDTAFRFGAETKMFDDSLSLSGNTKKIGFDFSPLGGTAIGVGSEYEEYNLKYAPDWHGFTSNYSYKYNKNPLGSSRTFFSRGQDQNFSGSINPNNTVKLDINYRHYATADDPLSPGASRNNDNLQEALGGVITPALWKIGELSLSQKYELRKSISQTDVIDRSAAYTSSTTDFYNFSGDLKFTDRFSAGYNYQLNEPITVGSTETVIAHRRSLSNSYNASLDFSSPLIPKGVASFSLINQQELKSLPTPESATTTKNETYRVEFSPHSILTAAFDHNRQERSAYVTGAENPLTMRTAGTLRLSPVPWLGLGFNASQSEVVPETGSANKTEGQSRAYDVSYIPINSPIVRLNLKLAGSEAQQTAPLGVERVRTDTNTFSQTYSLGLTPHPLLPIELSLIQEDYKNINNSVASPVTTETQNQIFRGKVSFTPITQLRLSVDYDRKLTTNLRTNASSPKTLTNAKISYQVASWGTLNFDLGDERNEGEVQGGVLTSLNFQKTTQTLSLNINLPTDSSVLSSFILTASLKNVDYKDFNKSSNNFRASLMNLEGTMNF